ncbi:MAG: GNAT family N-acetyltransferase [Lachnospiraceae bacterium]|nr:GNAT family N-acetyltransferase [Lachnospiraceae bacterium]
MELIKWDLSLQEELINICNAVDRSFLSNRLPFPYTTEAAKWWLTMVSEHDGKDGVFRAITVDGKVVGNISVEQKSDVYCRDGEIGYMLIDDYKGKGIMTEAAAKICEIAFSELNLLRITGLVYAPNVASQKVLLKNGFMQEGFQKNAVYKNGEVYDLCLFGKVR